MKHSRGIPAHQRNFQEELGKERYATLLAELEGVPRRGMTDQEMVAIRHYTGSGHDRLNRALLSGSEAEKATVANFKRTLQDALAKLPDEEAGIFYRGVDLRSRALERYVVGETVTEEYFLSSSRNPKKRFPGNAEFYVHGRHGKNVIEYSQHRGEEEILFTADTRYRVLSVERDADKWVIQMREVE